MAGFLDLDLEGESGRVDAKMINASVMLQWHFLCDINTMMAFMILQLEMKMNWSYLAETP